MPMLDKSRADLAEMFSGIGAEIGVAAGEFSEIILRNPRVKHLYAIDPWEPYKGYRDYTKKETFARLFQEASERLTDRATIIQDYSMNAIIEFEDDSLNFVYIDANHDYEHVTRDITHWAKKVKPGGIVAGDDYVQRKGQDKYYDVVRAVNDYVAANNQELLILKGSSPTQWMFYR